MLVQHMFVAGAPAAFGFTLNPFDLREVLLPAAAYKLSDAGHFKFSSPSLLLSFTVEPSRIAPCAQEISQQRVSLILGVGLLAQHPRSTQIAGFAATSIISSDSKAPTTSLEVSIHPLLTTRPRLTLSHRAVMMLAVIVAGIVLGFEVAFLVFLFVLRQQRVECRDGANNNVDDSTIPAPTVAHDPILPGTYVLPSSPAPAQTTPIDSTIESLPPIIQLPTVEPHPISTPVLSSSTPSAPFISTLSSNPQRTLSQSSRSAYEAEIERLRQEVTVQKNHITHMREQMEFTHIGGTPPPSYRSRRSNNSDHFGSSSLPPLPPLNSPLMQPPTKLDGA
ncbi:hypothetical protein EDD18DRAFT_1334352 [Armillaria luteobubalina]|uniref:Uncharacterized protein n=1 Tax=Armillaria luteobubalina TaxID=153913 RepID=A0AA39PYF4_9AGAR|nr:hypothetical protein EDD18DRAFT_1334352 [Armillaria luteobubalina]